jgi:hypothetical protein
MLHIEAQSENHPTLPPSPEAAVSAEYQARDYVPAA